MSIKQNFNIKAECTLLDYQLNLNAYKTGETLNVKVEWNTGIWRKWENEI